MRNFGAETSNVQRKNNGLFQFECAKATLFQSLVGKRLGKFLSLSRYPGLVTSPAEEACTVICIQALLVSKIYLMACVTLRVFLVVNITDLAG